MDDQNNPYRAPDATIIDVAIVDGDLADRGERLAAALLDGLLYLVVAFPIMYFSGVFNALVERAASGEDSSALLLLGWSAFALVLYIAIQGYPLYSRAQTWGKRLLGIRIVDSSGRRASFSRLIGLRYLPIKIVSMLPVLGLAAVWIDILLIFRSDRRCGHDLLAGTRVVKAR